MKVNIADKMLKMILITVLATGCGKKEAPVPVTEVDEKLFFKVQSIIGDVRISGISGSREAKVGDNIGLSESIVTAKKAVADLVFGSSGVIRINENSKVKVKSIADKKTSDTVLDMDKGRIYVTLAKLKGNGFRVKTPTAVASVRGTSFTVVADNKGAKLSVAKGTVAVNPVKDGKIFEEKSASVEAGNKTGYIDKKSVEKIIAGRMEIPVMEMTPAEKIEIQTEVKNIKIETIPDLSMELKEEVKQQVEVPVVAATRSKVSRKESSVKSDERDEAQKKIEEEKRKKEEELKKLAEEKKLLEEKKKKDRASNIPTL